MKPLWMPEGSVRSLIALIVVISLSGFTAFMLAEHPEAEITKLFVGGWLLLSGGIVTHYFNVRQNGGEHIP
ncbi:MAG: hypothetical protein ACYS8L_09400 [Planctomycetota bacterium]|jgi:hypothetical protein